MKTLIQKLRNEEIAHKIQLIVIGFLLGLIVARLVG